MVQLQQISRKKNGSLINFALGRYTAGYDYLTKKGSLRGKKENFLKDT